MSPFMTSRTRLARAGAWLILPLVAFGCRAGQATAPDQPRDEDHQQRSVSGVYTWTMTAASGCGIGAGDGSLPEEARERRYTASVTQSDAGLSIQLSGADFAEPMAVDRRISGRLEPTRAVFNLFWGDSWTDTLGPAQIAETLSTGETLVIDGVAQGGISDGRIAGVLSAGFYVYPRGVLPTVGTIPTARCFSTQHQFVMSAEGRPRTPAPPGHVRAGRGA